MGSYCPQEQAPQTAYAHANYPSGEGAWAARPLPAMVWVTSCTQAQQVPLLGTPKPEFCAAGAVDRAAGGQGAAQVHPSPALASLSW